MEPTRRAWTQAEAPGAVSAPSSSELLAPSNQGLALASQVSWWDCVTAALTTLCMRD